MDNILHLPFLSVEICVNSSVNFSSRSAPIVLATSAYFEQYFITVNTILQQMDDAFCKNIT